VVAWEDRRPGHTVIMAAVQRHPDECGFLPPQRISQRPKNIGNLPYGKGHGVSRAALAGFGDKAIMAVWEDKRNFREGYDVYASEYRGDGKFGDNTRVQDDFAGLAQQWHVAVAGGVQGNVVVAWDDNREGNADVMLSWPEEDGWSEDLPIPGASGTGEQSHPSIVFDDTGNLHIVWLERETAGATTRLYYMIGH
jgi:hypothetical protein